MEDNEALTAEIAKSLLNPAKPSVFSNAEQMRPWLKRRSPLCGGHSQFSIVNTLWDSAPMRSYDCLSGSQPDSQHRMLARAPRMRLDTEDLRRETLTVHADHANWTETPYISFTTCPKFLQDTANSRSRKERNRGPQTVVVVDPRVRIELGLPVIHFHEEMEYYNVDPPYKNDYWTKHFLCLWEVLPAEVVGVWSWDDLRSNANWYDNIIVPAILQHRLERQMIRPGDAGRQQCAGLFGPICTPPPHSTGVFWDYDENEYKSLASL